MVTHFNKAYNLSAVLILLGATVSAQTAAVGLSPGGKIPDFSLQDQFGTPRFFDDIRGPKGALLVFYRSADW